MTAAHRDFDAEDLELLPAAATFTLAGKLWHVKSAEDWPFGTAERMFGAGDAQKVMLQIGPFFKSVLVPDEADAFLEMLSKEDTGNPATLRRVMQVIEFVAEEVLGFPIKLDSGSSEKRPARARKQGSSKESSSSQGTRRRASGE